MDISGKVTITCVRSLVVVSLIGLLIGCRDDYSTYPREYTHELELVEEYDLQIYIDSTEQQQSFYFQVFNDEDDLYMAWSNRLENSIDIYDLRYRNRKNRISFPEEGPNSLPKLRGFYFFSLDSFFVKKYNSDDIYFINSSNLQLNDKYSFYSDKVHKSSDYLSVTPDCPIFVFNNRVYLCARNPYNSYTDYDRKYSESPLGRWVDLVSLENGYTAINRYPDTYKNKVLPSEFWGFSRCINLNGELVYSFPIDHNIYVAKEVTSGSKLGFSSHLLKGDRVPDRMNKNKATNELEEIKYKIESAVYSSIYYDKYREVYLRFYRHDGIARNPQDIYGSMEDYGSRPASVIIADKNFQKIGEHKFSDDRYDVRNVIFLPDGIYISDAHPRNLTLEENVISFSKFTIKKIDD